MLIPGHKAPPLGELDSTAGRRLRGRVSDDTGQRNVQALSVTASPCHLVEWSRDYIALSPGQCDSRRERSIEIGRSVSITVVGASLQDAGGYRIRPYRGGVVLVGADALIGPAHAGHPTHADTERFAIRARDHRPWVTMEGVGWAKYPSSAVGGRQSRISPRYTRWSASREARSSGR